MTSKELVNDVLGQYGNDEIMLDAFYQWASNPTPKSATPKYGLEENYPYIMRNIEVRYVLSRQEVEGYIIKLKKECDSLITKAEDLPIKPINPIDEIQSTLTSAIEQSDYGKLLRQGVLQRLTVLSEETRRALLLLNLLEKYFGPISSHQKYDYLANQPEFQAYYMSVYADTAPIEQITREIIRSGACSELYWIPSKNATSIPQSVLVKATVPTISELESLGTSIPSVPDITSLLDSHLENGDYDLLVLVDEVSYSFKGIREQTKRSIGTNIPGFMGSHGSSVALSPIILAETRQCLNKMKYKQMDPLRKKLDNALRSVEKSTQSDVYLNVLMTSSAETVWKFETSNEPPLYIYLSPWITTTVTTEAPSKIEAKEKSHVLFVTPYQGKLSLLSTIKQLPSFSTRDSRYQKSISYLSDLYNLSDHEILLGQSHPILDSLLAMLGSSSVRTIKNHIAKTTVIEEEEAIIIRDQDKIDGIVKSTEDFSISFPPYSNQTTLIFGRDKLQGKIAWGYELGKRLEYDSMVISDLTDINEGHIGFFMSVRNGKSTLAASAILQAAFQSIPVVVIDPKPDYVSNMIPLSKGLTVNPAFKQGTAPRFENVRQDKRGFDLWEPVEFIYQGQRNELQFQVVTFTKERKSLPRTLSYKAPLLALPLPEDEDFQEQCDEAATSLTQDLPTPEGKGFNTLISKAIQQFKHENREREFLLVDDLLSSLDSIEDELFTTKDIISLKKILSGYQTKTSSFFAKEPRQVSDISKLLNPGLGVVPITILDVSGLTAKGKGAAQQNFISQVCGQIYHYVQKNRGRRAVELLLVLDEAQGYLPDPTNQYNYVRKLIQEGPSLGIRVILISQSPQDIEMTARQQLKTLILSNVPEGTIQYVAKTFSLPSNWRDKLNKTKKGIPLIINEKTAETGGALCNAFTTPQMVGLLTPEDIKQAMDLDSNEKVF